MKKRSSGEKQITREMPAGTVDSPKHCWNKHEERDYGSASVSVVEGVERR